MLEEFTTAFGQTPDKDLGFSLILEEDAELVDALMFKDDEEILGELADSLYVRYWYAWSRGWDLDEALRRKHQANMSKLGEDGKPVIREDGKVLKGPNFKPAYLKDLVDG